MRGRMQSLIRANHALHAIDDFGERMVWTHCDCPGHAFLLLVLQAKHLTFPS